MNLAVSSKLVVVLLTIAAAAASSVVLLGRSTSCVPRRCADLSGDGEVMIHPGDGSYRHLVLSGRPAWALTPGADVPINLRLTNPNSFAMTARNLTVRIGDIEAPRSTSTRPCSVHDFTIAQSPDHLTLVLPAHRSTTLDARRVRRADWPWVQMVNRGANQDGCKGASVTLRYTATGRQLIR
jgi:hypothetical protein